MTVSITYGSTGSAYPYTATYTSTGNVGDVLICAATSIEFDSATAGSRTLAMVTAGWTQLGLEEFQRFPPQPNRRLHLATWWKVATTTSDTVNVTLSGATYTLLTLQMGVIRIAGIPFPAVVDQGPATRRDNVDLGVNPALTWTHAPSAADSTQISMIVWINDVGSTPAATPPTGYAFPSAAGVPFMSLHGGDVSCAVYWRTGPSPSTVTFANFNGSAAVSSLTLDFAHPVLIRQALIF